MRPLAAPQISSASAPRLASFSTSTGIPRRPLASAAASTPTQPGRIDEACTAPVARSIGAGRPIPTPITRDRLDVRLGEHLLDELGGRVEALLGRVVDVHLAPGLGEHGVGEVRDGDPQVAVAEVDAEHEAGRLVERDHHRRPAGVRLAVGLTVAFAGQPASSRSPTMVEIVERERPVIRDSSARLAEPGSRRASITRLRLPSRSDASDPLFPLTPRIHSHGSGFVKP